MVKKTRVQAGTTQSLGYVCNDELLDDILGEETNCKKLQIGQQKKKLKQQKLDTEQEDSAEENFYSVERIIEKKKEGKKVYYFVKWEGYSEDQNTWEPLSNLSNVKDLVKEFEHRLEMQANNQSSTCLNTNNQSSVLSAEATKNESKKGGIKGLNLKSKVIKKQIKMKRPQEDKKSIEKNNNRPETAPLKPELLSRKQQEIEAQLQAIQQQKQLILQQQQQVQEQELKMMEALKIQQLQQLVIKEKPQEQQQVQAAYIPIKKTAKQLFAQRKNNAPEPSVTQLQPQVEETKTVQTNQESVNSNESLSRRGRKKGMLKKQNNVEEEKMVEINDTIDMEEEACPNGSFQTDIPERVLGAKLSQGMIHVTIEWKARSNGFKPSDSVFLNEEIKVQCPRLLVDFYESRINSRQKSQDQQPHNH